MNQSATESSILDGSSLILDDSLSFSNKFDFEETIRQIQEQSKKVSSHLNQYSKYLIPSPKGYESEKRNTENAYSSTLNTLYNVGVTNNNQASSKNNYIINSVSSESKAVEVKEQPKPKQSFNAFSTPQSSVDPKYANDSDPIEALMRDFRNEVREIDNCIQSDTPSSLRFSSSDFGETPNSEEPKSPFLYQTSTPLNSTAREPEKRANKLNTEALPLQSSTYNRGIMEEEKTRNKIHSNTNIFEKSHEKDQTPSISPIIHNSRMSQTSSPIITFTTSDKSRMSDTDIRDKNLFSPTQGNSFLKEHETSSKPSNILKTNPLTFHSQQTSSEMILRLENIQLREEISKLQSTVVSLQTRMEGMEKNMKQLFDLLMHTTMNNSNNK